MTSHPLVERAVTSLALCVSALCYILLLHETLNYVGASDGSHIPIHVVLSKQDPCRELHQHSSADVANNFL